MANGLTHFDKEGNAVMVDVSGKSITYRTALATGYISVGPEIMTCVTEGNVKKGDVLGVARVAGIMGVKKTSELIPMCHPLPIQKCSIDYELDHEKNRIHVFCTVKTEGKTGVEMEALTGVQVTLLTIYDMLKAVDRGMCMTDIRLLEKHQIRATMFAVCRTAQREKERLQRYLRRGHRLALHGLQHTPPDCMDDARFLRETREAKALLEEEFQTKVTGYRAPCFSLDKSKLNILRGLGFRYDSSRMDFAPARHVEKLDMSDFRELLKGVFRKNGFYEFGMTCQKLFGKNYPISGGGYVRLGHWGFILPLIGSYLRENDYYVFYLHPFELSRERPPAMHGLKLYDRYYLNSGLHTYRVKVEAIIRMLKSCGYTFVTFDELADILERKGEIK